MVDGSAEQILATFTAICEDICTKHVPPRSATTTRRQIAKHRRILMRKRSFYKTKLAIHPPSNIEQKLQGALQETETSLLKVHEEQRKHEKRQAVSYIKMEFKTILFLC